jgi:hypothetical protein
MAPDAGYFYYLSSKKRATGDDAGKRYAKVKLNSNEF